MRVFVVVNEVREIGARQTTALLIAALNRSGYDVALANVHEVHSLIASGDHSRSESTIVCTAIPADRTDSSKVEWFAQSDPGFRLEPIFPGDLILIRTNPGRDLERKPIHDRFLESCRGAKSIGIDVVNDPSHLSYFANKASLASLDPTLCPAFLVSDQAESIAAFVRDSGRECVIKPLAGSRGQNVIRVSPETPALETLIAKQLLESSVIVQHFVHSEQPGDKRVITVGGSILELDGKVAGIERRPKIDDFRANLHAGGTAHPLILNASERSTVRAAAELLVQHGIWLAGVDLIGNQIIEFNVFSTGGLFDAERFTGLDYCGEIVARLGSWLSHSTTCPAPND